MATNLTADELAEMIDEAGTYFENLLNHEPYCSVRQAADVALRDLADKIVARVCQTIVDEAVAKVFTERILNGRKDP